MNEVTHPRGVDFADSLGTMSYPEYDREGVGAMMVDRRLSHPVPREADYLQRGRPATRRGDVRVNTYPQGDGPWVGNPDPYAAYEETAPLDRAGTLGPAEPRAHSTPLSHGSVEGEEGHPIGRQVPPQGGGLAFRRGTVERCALEAKYKPSAVPAAGVAPRADAAAGWNCDPDRRRAVSQYTPREGVAP